MFWKKSDMKNKKDKLPVVQKWGFSKSVSLKTLTTEHQDHFPLINMTKKMVWHSFKEDKILISYLIYDITNAQGKKNLPRAGNQNYWIVFCL